MPFVALAVLGASFYTANRQAGIASRARQDAQRQAAATAEQATQQLNAQRDQAKVARDRLNFEIGKTSEERATVERQASEAAQTLEQQQRMMAEEESNRMRQMRRGGFRSLLSQERANPEAGLGSFGGSTLGSGTSLR